MLKDNYRKKILIVANNTLEIGGIQSVIMSIVRNLSDKYIFDIIVFSGLDDYYSKEFMSYGGKIFVLPHYFGSNRIIRNLDYMTRFLREYSKTKNIIKENGPYEAIHCHTFLESAIYIKAAFDCGVAVRIAHSHNYFFPLPKRKIIRRLYEREYRRIINLNTTSIVACSKKAGEWLSGGEREFIVVNNAIDLNEFKFINDNPESINPLSIIHVGRWCGQKNQVFLLRVVSEIKKVRPEVHLSLIGYGTKEDKDIVDKEIDALQLKDNVSIYPSDSNISELLSKNNLFVFPSAFEGLGIVLIEAQSTGQKCFASTAVPEEADLGLVDFLPLDKGPKYWADEIIDYVNKNGSQRKFVSLDSYDIKNIIKEYEDLYRKSETLN